MIMTIKMTITLQYFRKHFITMGPSILHDKNNPKHEIEDSSHFMAADGKYHQKTMVNIIW